MLLRVAVIGVVAFALLTRIAGICATGLGSLSSPKHPTEGQTADDGAGSGHEPESPAVTPPTISFGGNREGGAAGGKGGGDSQGRYYQDDVSCTAWITAVSTAGLLVVGIVVACYQYALMRGSLRVATLTAKAASRDARNTRRALKQAQLAERAWIAFEVTRVDGIDELLALYEPFRMYPHHFVTLADPVVTLNATYQYQNGGKTVARVTAGNTKFELIAAWPEPPDYGPPEVVNAPDFVILPDGHSESEVELPLSKVQVGEFFRREKFLAIYGFLAYSDIWGKPHETRGAYAYLFTPPPARPGFHLATTITKSYSRVT
jgi:hypothetical protein